MSLDMFKEDFINWLIQQVEEEKETVIKKSGKKWILYTKDGKRKLGTHDTREEALAQERAIMANKGGK